MKTRRLTRREELIWLAAFFEAEGCIHLAASKHPGMRSGVQHRIVISVAQNHKQPLLRLQRRFGGTIHSRVKGNTHSWYWVCSSAIAVAAIKEMVPFLEMKKEQAELAIEFQSRKQPRGRPPLTDAEVRRNQSDYEKMRALKKVR